MALVDYSDSASSDDDPPVPIQAHIAARNSQHALERKGSHDAHSNLPPLPESFHDLYASTSRTASQDDPSLHAGRQRLTPHVEGNWPTHVYIEWYPSKEESVALQDLVAKVSRGQVSDECHVHSLLKSDLGAALPLHISLSRPIRLLTHQRQSFHDALALGISKSVLQPFTLCVRGLNWVANQEKTRWFLVIRIEKPPKNELARLLYVTNGVAEGFGQLPLYGEPQQLLSGTAPRGQDDVSSSFHISIGWSLNPPPNDSSVTLKNEIDARDIAFQLHVSSVKVKIGNGVTAISLASKVKTSNGIIGS